ncbi:mannosyl-glycoprotein endo-beta-N-acetylglucosaminidase/flagellar protein FlgJ [Flexibacter flexilis DSM 6793]|uniref:Mannosyl-glycoprotein endo-beta-N-acetylglucosaminidase/flagellar protein FlgJ n=1 Tax=Flexibacter flexilis DSM 6793 TaxID=927664 RepID=A0A1I1P454_9BACT|nr:glucosaminidase domain-containing protein [Flexibacter flexilis]SFD02468.1 mannosyl-glycoprotein endo-beta-N-acetylglucosaminidase/flagellar protein FlgJ [Flexibacter flexilis DSM 6793]
MTPKEFVQKFGKAAAKACAGTKLFTSVCLAQMALETGWGKDGIATKYNNWFGIKADASWKGKKVLLLTVEEVNGVRKSVKQWFRVYDTADESIKDRVKFLLDNPRYKQFGVFAAKTPAQQAQALEKAGYATASNYNEVIESIIKSNNLTALDDLAETLAEKK